MIRISHDIINLTVIIQNFVTNYIRNTRHGILFQGALGRTRILSAVHQSSWAFEWKISSMQNLFIVKITTTGYRLHFKWYNAQDPKLFTAPYCISLWKQKTVVLPPQCKCLDVYHCPTITWTLENMQMTRKRSNINLITRIFILTFWYKSRSWWWTYDYKSHWSQNHMNHDSKLIKISQ